SRRSLLPRCVFAWGPRVGNKRGHGHHRLSGWGRLGGHADGRDDRFRGFRAGRHSRRHHRGGDRLPRGAQAVDQAQDRLRRRDRGEALGGADHGALQDGSADRPAGLRRGEFPAAPDRPVHERGPDPRDARRGRRRRAHQARLQGAGRRPPVLMATHYYTVTWDQLHRDARALAWRLIESVSVLTYEEEERGTPTVIKHPAVAGDGTGFLIVDDLVDTGATARVV